ncbi:hypothetical protein BH11ARM2_BH11ARM2_01090 [soil metagenome]
MRGRNAFTLVELLVVIAIIAVLAALLFPVFAQAKQAAKESVSLSNMKQVGTAAALYLSDNDDQNPQGDDNSEWLWAFYFYPYAKQAPGDLSGGKNTIYWSPLSGDIPQYLAGEARVSLAQTMGIDKQFGLKLVDDPNGVESYAFWSSTAINEALSQEWPNMSEGDDLAGTIYFAEAIDSEVEGDELLELYGRTHKCQYDLPGREDTYEFRAAGGGYQGGANYVYMDLHTKWHKHDPFDPSVMEYFDDPLDAWCYSVWVYPTGSGGGLDNCGTWSPKRDHMDALEGLCIDDD